MAGYWPRSLFTFSWTSTSSRSIKTQKENSQKENSFSFYVFMDLDFVSVHKNAKRELGQYPTILTELAWSIKDLLYGIKSTEKNDLRTCLFSSIEKEPS